MNDGLFYLLANLVCNSVMVVSASWLLTDHRLRRLMRACHAFIAAGAAVNVMGMVADLLGYRNISYGHIWPGEVVANFGTAVLLAAWLYRSAKRPRHNKPFPTQPPPPSL